MEEQIELLKLSPLHLHSIITKIKDLSNLKEHLISTSKTFQLYQEAVSQMSANFKKLSASIGGFPEFANDPTIQSISRTLSSYSQIFSDHMDQVQDIVSRLKEFVQNDVTDAEEKGKKAKHDVDQYFKFVENYAMLSKKKPQMTQQEADGKLKANHWTAVLSDFQYHRALELVERKKLYELTAHFLLFMNSSNIAFRQCTDVYESSQDSFKDLLLALSDPSSSFDNYSTETDQLQKSLVSLYKTYWKRLSSQTDNSTDQLEYEGYLWKKGSGITKSWQKRYFICKNNELAYYHNAEDSDRPSGALPLLLTTIKPFNDPDRYNTFTIVSQKKVYNLQALTQWDMNQWTSVIRNNIEYLLNHSNSSIKTKTTNATDSVIESIDPTEASIALSNLPQNLKCADCRAEHPSWCCINWGICICINCSGVHRNLTSSVSKVRSLTLDKIDPYSRRLIELIGNENANKILEANLGELQMIDPTVSKEQRELYIRLKYQECAMTIKRGENVEIDIFQAIKDRDVLKIYKALCVERNMMVCNSMLYEAKIEKRGKFTPLHYAAAIGDPLIVHLLALNTDTPSSLDDGGWSPLSYAAYYGHIDAAQVLLRDGSNPKATLENHPYHIAISRGKQNLASMLLPFWDGDENVEPKEFKPPVNVDEL